MSDEAFHVLIPARLGSTRLPGKALAPIAGRAMIVHVAGAAARSGARTVHVATDHESIRETCAAAGIAVVMTAPEHRSGTERLAEACATLALEAHEIVVNVQGDEPLLPPVVVRQVARLLAASPDAEMASLYVPLDDAREVFDPNVVKVVCDAADRALYFSRAPIPWDRAAFASGPDGAHAAGQRRHIGIYAYRVGFLRRYVALEPAPQERLEALEQLRALYHGTRIVMARALELPGPGVDTAEDLERVRAILENRQPSG